VAFKNRLLNIVPVGLFTNKLSDRSKQAIVYFPLFNQVRLMARRVRWMNFIKQPDCDSRSVELIIYLQTVDPDVLRRGETVSPASILEVKPASPFHSVFALDILFHHVGCGILPSQKNKSACTTIMYSSIAMENERIFRSNPIIGAGIAKKVLTIAKGEMK
jgi:hypothetical protein